MGAPARPYPACVDTPGNTDSQSPMERLYWAASHHAQAANLKVSSGDRHLRMEAAIHAGAAVELMAKAILARVDPRLLTEDRDGHHIVVDMLVGSGEAVASKRRGSGSQATVSARKALDLALRLCPEVVPHDSAAGVALKARNAAAHAAEVDDTKLADQVTAANDFVLAGVDSFGRSRTSFIGDALDQVEREVAERNAALKVKARHAVELAKRRYDTPAVVMHGSDPTKVSSRVPFHGDHYDRYECPACANQGWLIWNVEVELDAADERNVNAYLNYIGFACFYCGLELTDAESDAVGIRPHGDPADYFVEEVDQ